MQHLFYLSFRPTAIEYCIDLKTELSFDLDNACLYATFYVHLCLLLNPMIHYKHHV